MYSAIYVYGKRAFFSSDPRRRFLRQPRTKIVAVALERKSIKIPLRSLGEYSAGIIVQFARITRISRVFLP